MNLHVQARLRFDFGIEFLIAIISNTITRYLRLASALFKSLLP